MQGDPEKILLEIIDSFIMNRNFVNHPVHNFDF